MAGDTGRDPTADNHVLWITSGQAAYLLEPNSSQVLATQSLETE